MAGTSIGVAELLVHGDNPTHTSMVLPSSPQGLKATQGTVLLTWTLNVAPDVGGYRVYYGTAPGQYTMFLDVGD